MVKLNETTVIVVAADTRSAIKDIDIAVVSKLRLAATAIEGISEAGVPVTQSQHLIATFHEGLGKLAEGRQSLVAAVRQMQIIHKRSNQAELDVGCTAPWELFTTSLAADDVQASASQAQAVS